MHDDMKRLAILLLCSICVVVSHDTYARKYHGNIGAAVSGNSFGAGRGGGLGLRKGYCGMTEIGAGFDFDAIYPSVVVSTTHGYQFNPYFFLGGGIGYQYGMYESVNGYYYGGYYLNNYFDESYNAFRFFADVRGYLLDRRFTPFIGCRSGLEINDYSGITYYTSGSLGVRWRLIRSFALDFSIDVETGPDYYGALLFRLGFVW